MKKQELGRLFTLKRQVLRVAFSMSALFLVVLRAGAQDVPRGPLTPPPEHEVKRVAGIVVAEAPPPIPPGEMVKKFSQKEDEFLAARGRYGYHKSIRIDEFGADGKPAGQFYLEMEASRASDGKVFERVVSTPQSTLHFLKLEPEDAAALARIPAYPLITGQLEKYEIKYLGTEKVDEVDTAIFDVKPKAVERNHALFEGVVWVDSRFMEVVKTYGKWETDLGDVHSPTLPFSMFETYRENVDGKYWLPNYSRADDVLHLQDRDVPIRVTIKWTEFKAFAVAAPPVAPASSATPPGKPKS